MKAILKPSQEPETLEWGEWPEPQLGATDVLVEIERAGICSTDVAIYTGTYRGRKPLVTPTMLGHEAAGTVSAIGGEVNDIAIGDRVALQVIWGHPHAPESLRGHENLDSDWIHIGASALGGAFAERIAVPASKVLLVPDSVGWEDAAMIEPLAVAVHAMDLVNVRPSDSVVIVGPGPFGLLMCLIAQASGARRVVTVGVSGVDEDRLAVAEQLGIDTLRFDGDGEAVLASLRELIGSAGADVVMDCGGTGESTFLSLDAAAPAGRVGVFGFTREATIEPLRQIIRKGLTLYGVSAAQRHHYGTAIRMMEAGTIKPSDIISHRFPLSETETGLQLARDKKACKVLLQPQTDSPS